MFKLFSPSVLVKVSLCVGVFLIGTLNWNDRVNFENNTADASGVLKNVINRTLGQNRNTSAVFYTMTSDSSSNSNEQTPGILTTETSEKFAEPVVVVENVGSLSDESSNVVIINDNDEQKDVQLDAATIEALQNDEADSEILEQDGQDQTVVKEDEQVLLNNNAGWVISTDDKTNQDDEITIPVPKAGNEQSLSNEFWLAGFNGNYFYCWKLVDGAWKSVKYEDFLKADNTGYVNVVWAHGYQTDMQSAIDSANTFRRTIDFAKQITNETRPCRLIVWKWSSERYSPRIRLDAKQKASLAEYNGKLLGSFLSGLNQKDDVALVGFSFGARVVGSALQHLATNSNRFVPDLKDYASTVKDGTRGKISLVLVSAACDRCSFGNKSVYSSGAVLPTRVLNIYNPSDSALHFYPTVSETRSEAIGTSPLFDDGFVNAKGNIKDLDINLMVGRKHAFVDEIQSVPANILIEYLF